MRFIGVLGIIALLGLAWALSYHKRDVKLRIVFWGLGLQFLFAVIILRQDYWSFVGLSVLAGLVSVYLLRVDRADPDRSPFSIAAFLTGAAVAGGLLSAAGPSLSAAASGLCLLLLVLNSKFRFAPRLQAPLGVLFVAGGVAWLIASNIYGQIIFIAFSEKVAAFLSLSDYGARFLFGNLADPQYFFPGGAALAGLRLPVRFQGPADDRLLRRLHGGPLLPRDHAEGDRGHGPVHALDGGHQRRRNPLVHRQHLRRPDRGAAADQALSRRHDAAPSC